MSDKRSLRAYAHGHDGAWEAICTDFDLAVQGESFAEVQALLHEAIAAYIADAGKESAADARRLLARRSPWWVRLGHAVGFIAHRPGHELRAGFDVPCPA